jgi:SAM-dependent methyltransferase
MSSGVVLPQRKVYGPAPSVSLAVMQEISPEDGMFEGSHEHYFHVGQSALRCIELALLGSGKSEIHSILDFGCGFGRVLRTLKAAFPTAQLTACDISEAALAFCARMFRAEALPSAEDVSLIKTSDRFDLIWCGTLLTNIDAFQTARLLDFFDARLNSDGVLVFTSHGPFVAERIRAGACDYGLSAEIGATVLEQYDNEGFGYGDYPEEVRRRLSLNKYGISIAKPSWVLSQIESRRGLRIVNYTEKAWDDHQDCVACVKRPLDERTAA